jgi:hypothetical protein
VAFVAKKKFLAKEKTAHIVRSEYFARDTLSGELTGLLNALVNLKELYDGSSVVSADGCCTVAEGQPD